MYMAIILRHWLLIFNTNLSHSRELTPWSRCNLPGGAIKHPFRSCLPIWVLINRVVHSFKLRKPTMQFGRPYWIEYWWWLVILNHYSCWLDNTHYFSSIATQLQWLTKKTGEWQVVCGQNISLNPEVKAGQSRDPAATVAIGGLHAYLRV